MKNKSFIGLKNNKTSEINKNLLTRLKVKPSRVNNSCSDNSTNYRKLGIPMALVWPSWRNV